MGSALIRWLLAAALLASLAAGLAAAESQKGRLRILQNGQPIGSERYEITATATEIHARGEIELRMDGVKVRQTASLLLNRELVPRKYEWKMEEPVKSWRRVEFTGSQATIRYPLEKGKEDQQVFDFGSARVAILDLYHHFLLLARLYDFSQGGPQTVQLFIPQKVQPGPATLELQGVETLTVEGQPQPVRQLSITTEDSRVLLWVTESGGFVRLRAPLENVEVVPESAAP
ncbi:MAG: hypothetical protein ACE5HL_04720 [Terriglobia bacterium]